MANEFLDPPSPLTPDLKKFEQEAQARKFDPARWADVPVVDPKEKPYSDLIGEIRSNSRTGTAVIVRPERQWFSFTPPHQVSPSVLCNPGPGDAQYGMNWSDSYTYQHTVGASVTAGATLKEIFQVSVTANYSYAWGETTTKGENVSMTVKEGYCGWLERCTLVNNVEGWFIWTGRNLSFRLRGPGDRKFRWRASMSGPGKSHEMTGKLITRQKKVSRTGVQDLQYGSDFERSGNLIILPGETQADLLTDPDDPGVRHVLTP